MGPEKDNKSNERSGHPSTVENSKDTHRPSTVTCRMLGSPTTGTASQKSFFFGNATDSLRFPWQSTPEKGKVILSGTMLSPPTGH